MPGRIACTILGTVLKLVECCKSLLVSRICVGLIWMLLLQLVCIGAVCVALQFDVVFGDAVAGSKALLSGCVCSNCELGRVNWQLAEQRDMHSSDCTTTCFDVGNFVELNDSGCDLLYHSQLEQKWPHDPSVMTGAVVHWTRGGGRDFRGQSDAKTGQKARLPAAKSEGPNPSTAWGKSMQNTSNSR